MFLRKTKVITLISTVLLLPIFAESYASWFVNENVACYRDLRAGEVIMNNEIIDASKSKYPNIRLVQTGGDGGGNDNKSEVIDFEPGQTFTLTISVPYDNVHDLQYVVETDDGGKMVGAGSGCDGRRASARNGDKVTLELSGAIETVNVLAGWATGHEAVTLTPPLIFCKKGTSKEETIKEEDHPEPQKYIPHPRRDINQQPKYRTHRINDHHHPDLKSKLRGLSSHHFHKHKRALHKKHTQFLEFASDSPFLANLSIGMLVLVLLIIFVKNCGGEKTANKGKHDL